MAYQQYATKFKEFLNNWSKAASGQGNSSSFNSKINTSQELQALKNSSTVNDLVQLSNAYYDQVSIGRSLVELNKSPKSYFEEFVTQNAIAIKKIDNLNDEVTSCFSNILDTTAQTKSIKILADEWQLKLSLIKSDFDNA